MKRIDNKSANKPFGSLRWIASAAGVGLASSLWLVAAPGEAQRVEAPVAPAADAGLPLGRAEPIEPHPQARVDHIAALPDEEQPPTF